MLGKACKDLAEMEEDPLRSDTDDSMLGLAELFEEQQSTKSSTWGGEEEQNKLLQGTPQQQCSSPEVCRATITTNGDATKTIRGRMLSNFDCSAISASIPSIGLVDNPHWQTAFDFNLEQKTGLSEFDECHRPAVAIA